MPSSVRTLASLALVLVLACKDAVAPPQSVLTVTFARDGELYSTDTSGTTPVPLMPLGESGYEPSWSPDGRYVAFTRALPSDYQIFVLDTRSGIETPLTAGPRDNFSPAWSPDGGAIAFLSRSKDSTGDATLNVIASNGTGQHELGTAHYYVRAPRWSPSGRQLVATDSAIEATIVDAATGTVVRVLAAGMSPAWSPDGKTIAFVCSGNSGAAICLIDVSGQNQRVISDSADYQPAWSPDGTHLAVESWRHLYQQNADADVYLMRADGTDQRQLTHGGSWDREPAWRKY